MKKKKEKKRNKLGMKPDVPVSLHKWIVLVPRLLFVL